MKRIVLINSITFSGAFTSRSGRKAVGGYVSQVYEIELKIVEKPAIAAQASLLRRWFPPDADISSVAKHAQGHANIISNIKYVATNYSDSVCVLVSSFSFVRLRSRWF